MKKFGYPQKSSTGVFSDNEIIVWVLNVTEEMCEFMVRKYNETIFAL
jgi:hypothetical protein